MHYPPRSNLSAYILRECQSSSSQVQQTKCDLENSDEGKRRRRPSSVVRFDGVTAVWPSALKTRDHEEAADFSSLKEVSSLWYTRDDYAKFRTMLVAEAKELLRLNRTGKSKDKSEQASIRRAYEMIICSSVSQETPSSNGFELFKALDLPISGCSDFVGLQQFVGKTIHRDRQRRRCMLWNAVFDIQSRSARHGKKFGEDLQSDVLRRVCEEISRPSRLFALYLGVASLSNDT